MGILIPGHRELNDAEARLIQRVKRAEFELQAVITELQLSEITDKRWVAIGVTDLQKGFMALTRSVGKPTF